MDKQNFNSSRKHIVPQNIISQHASENTFLKDYSNFIAKVLFLFSKCQELISIYIINSQNFQHRAPIPILRAAFMNNNVQNVMNLKKKILWQGKKKSSKETIKSRRLSSHPPQAWTVLRDTDSCYVFKRNRSLYSPFLPCSLFCSKQMWNNVQNHLCREPKIPEKCAEIEVYFYRGENCEQYKGKKRVDKYM